MAGDTHIQVRPMRPEEARELRAIARRSFPPQVMVLFSLTEHTLVAELQGKPVGLAVLKLFLIPGGRRGGVVLWLCVEPSARSAGAGQALVDAALAFFDAKGCTDGFACVEGYNTASGRRWARAGMGVLSPGAQFQRYGLGALSVLYHTFHFVDVGHLLWARPPAAKADRPWLQWWGAMAMNALVLGLALWRQNSFGTVPLFALGLCALMVLVFLGARTATMVLAARVQGLRVRYRVWESGFPLGIAIAAAFGGYYANPGGLYPSDDDWRYEDLLPRLGPMALAGVLTTLALLGALQLWRLLHGGAPTPVWHNVARWVGTSLAVLDILLPTFPLTSFNGRRLWDWKRWVWALAAVAALFLLVL